MSRPTLQDEIPTGIHDTTPCYDCNHYRHTGGCLHEKECNGESHFEPTPLRALDDHVNRYVGPESYMATNKETADWYKTLKEMMATVREVYRTD